MIYKVLKQKRERREIGSEALTDVAKLMSAASAAILGRSANAADAVVLNFAWRQAMSVF